MNNREPCQKKEKEDGEAAKSSKILIEISLFLFPSTFISYKLNCMNSLYEMNVEGKRNREVSTVFLGIYFNFL